MDTSKENEATAINEYEKIAIIGHKMKELVETLQGLSAIRNGQVAVVNTVAYRDDLAPASTRPDMDKQLPLSLTNFVEDNVEVLTKRAEKLHNEVSTMVLDAANIIKRHPDTARLDKLDNLSKTGNGWVCRNSTTGRGMRLHEMGGDDSTQAEVHPTVRMAIDNYNE